MSTCPAQTSRHTSDPVSPRGVWLSTTTVAQPAATSRSDQRGRLSRGPSQPEKSSAVGNGPSPAGRVTW